jgi:hypothetical protein
MQKISLVLIILAVLVLNILRFWKLDTIPDGYHVDEVGSAVTMQCMAQRGCDAELEPWPLFASMEYGQDKPPTYIYPGVIWVKLFGSTVPSLRAYSCFVLLIGIVGLFFLGRLLFGISFGLAVAMAASVSPWAWVVNRVALESYFAPVFAVWGLYFFWRSQRWGDWAISGFLFACAMYAYPPARMQIPLMLVTLGIYEAAVRRQVRWQAVVSMGSVMVLALLPMLPQYMNGVLGRRFKLISIFNPDYLHSIGANGSMGDVIRVFFHNYFLHLSPDFLFLRGDPSYVHSTRHSGIFSLFDAASLIILLVFTGLAVFRPAWRENPVIKHKGWLFFLAANFFIGIIPSALTNQELPHALRICGSWPFMMLFSGFMWWSAAQWLAGLWPAMALAGILSGALLVHQYFTVYPKESRGMFDFWIKDTAEQLRTPQDWQKFLLYFHRQNYHCMYFMVHLLGMDCKQAHDAWWKLHDELDKKGMF